MKLNRYISAAMLLGIAIAPSALAAGKSLASAGTAIKGGERGQTTQDQRGAAPAHIPLYGARWAMRGLTGAGSPPAAISAIILLMIAWPNELKFCATITKAPGPPITLVS